MPRCSRTPCHTNHAPPISATAASTNNPIDRTIITAPVHHARRLGDLGDPPDVVPSDAATDTGLDLQVRLKVYRDRIAGYRISELAERPGFPASPLRYYEQEGLLPPAERPPGGYRSYDERTVERLTFIARAKQLELPLDEIRELTTIWDAGSCAPVQHRLVDLLTTKTSDVDARVAALLTFRGQLVAARERLGQHTPDGPCDHACGCLTPAEPATRHAGQVTRTRPGSPLPVELAPTGDTEPIAC